MHFSHSVWFVSALALAACSHTEATNAQTFVSESREDGSQFKKDGYRIEAGDDCQPSIMKDSASVPSLDFTSGVGVSLEFCTTGGDHYFTAPELFMASAFWKVETSTGYIRGDVPSTVEVFPVDTPSCVSVFFVPILDGTYTAVDERCIEDGNSTPITINVTGQGDKTLEQETDSSWSQPSQQDSQGNDAYSSDWSGWEDPLFIEIVLVENPSCGTGRGRRLLQEGGEGEGGEGGEGDGGESSGNEDFLWMYTGGWTSASTPLVKGLDDIEKTEGSGEAGAVQDKSEMGTATVNAIDASVYPIEMIAGEGYILTFQMLRAARDEYFTAVEFFKSSVVRKITDGFVEAKFQTYPTEMELFDDRGTFELYVVPTTPGEYEFSSGEVSDRMPPGIIKVLGSKDELSGVDDFEPVAIYQGSC